MTRAFALSTLALAALPAISVHAEECPEDNLNQPGSCYHILPSRELVLQGTSVVPFDHYRPYAWRGAEARVEPPEAKGADMTDPGMRINLGGGAWGEGAKEPMAISRLSFDYLVDDGVVFMPATDGNNGRWYTFACEPDTPLCYDPEFGPAGMDLWTRVETWLRRSYRITKTNPAPLPSSVTHVPVLTDYRMSTVVTGKMDFAGVSQQGMYANAWVWFGYWEKTKSGVWSYYSEGVQAAYAEPTIFCAKDGSSAQLPGVKGSTCTGTLSTLIPIAQLDMAALSLKTSVSFPRSAGCTDYTTPEGTVCAIKPWNGSGHAVADPYVYVDPKWEYASWFKLEMSADESDTTWVTPERTPIDPENLKTLEDGGAPDSGTSQADAGAGSGDGDGDGNTSGDGDGTVGGDGDITGVGDGDATSPALDGGSNGVAKKGDGGCQLGGRGGAASSLWLLSVIGLLFARSRRSARASRARVN